MAPQLRYCAYNIGDETAVSDLVQMHLNIGTEQDDQLPGDLDALIAETQAAQTKTSKPEVKWCGHTITTDNPARVGAFCAALAGFDERIVAVDDFDEKINLYERLIMDCRDAIQALRDDTKSEQLTKVTKRSTMEGGDENLSPAQLLHSYLSYVRYTKMTERTLLTVEQMRSSGGGIGNSREQQGGSSAPVRKSVKPQDLVRLYDSVLQYLGEMTSLPGTEVDETYQAELEMKQTYYKAFRCHYVAEAFGAAGKWAEAYAVCERGLEYGHEVAQAPSLHQKGGSRGKNAVMTKAELGLNPSKGQLSELEHKLNVAKFTAYANVLGADHDVTGGGRRGSGNEGSGDMGGDPQSQLPLDERIREYRSWGAMEITEGKIPLLTRLPPDFEAISCKPLFFDVAINHITFPSLDEVLGASPGSGAEAKEEGGGITGFVKGWFWGSGKK